MLLKSKRVWLDGLFHPAIIEIENQKIINILEYSDKDVDYDYGSLRIIPGMIDVHCHGGYGFDTNDATAGLLDWCQKLPNEGITAFCPTTVTQSEEVLLKALANVAYHYENGYEGSEILGIHLEGPFLDINHKGAQPEQHIIKPSIAQFEKFDMAAKGLIKIVTLAAEKDIDFELSKYCFDKGIRVSLGHSGATYEQALLAFQNGVTGTTHCYNGMSDALHRDPNIPSAVIEIDNCYSELICDGQHVAPSIMKQFIKAKNNNHILMIDDALCTKCCPPGDYELGGQKVEVRENGLCYIKGTDTISGGTMKFNEGLKFLIEELDISWQTVIKMASLNPATYLGVEDRKGKLAYGYDADIVVLNDDYEVNATFLKGNLYHKK